MFRLVEKAVKSCERLGIGHLITESQYCKGWKGPLRDVQNPDCPLCGHWNTFSNEKAFVIQRMREVGRKKRKWLL